MSAATAWQNYPANWSRCETNWLNTSELLKRLKDPSGMFFAGNDDKINVRITDINDGKATSMPYNEAGKLWERIEGDEDNSIRIISIYSERTIKPLQITSELMRKILHRYDVHPNFLRVLFSFGEEPHLAEASSDHLAIQAGKADGETYITYKVNYVEEKSLEEWSFRHTGVYHHHTSNSDLFIILHPNNSSVLERRLLKMVEAISSTQAQASQLAAFCEDRYQLHLLVMSSFFDNWRWYFRYLGELFKTENNRAMVIKPEKADAQESFGGVKSLRNLNDFALFAKACCSSNLDIVERLKSSNSTPLKNDSSLEFQSTILGGHVESGNVLEGRIRNAIELVGYTLTLHNQLELRDMTKELRDVTEQLKTLQQSTVDDSFTVKIITLVSAFYLPGSFVASLYGMNFFAFDTTTYEIVIAHDFWVFAVTWLPLTLITSAIYILAYWLHSRAAEKRSDRPVKDAKTIESKA